MIRSGFSSMNFRLIAPCSSGSAKAATESGRPAISAEPGNVIEIAATVAEAEDVDLVLCREVTDLVEGGDFVTPVRRERHPLAYEENSHRRTSVGPPAGNSGFDDQIGRGGRAAEQIRGPNRPDAGLVVDGKREQRRNAAISHQQISGVIGNCVTLWVDDIEMDHVERGL